MSDFVFFTQALIAAVFTWAVTGKVLRRGAFASFVLTVRAVGVASGHAKAVAVGVVAAEIAVVVATLIPAARVVGLGGAAALLAGFAVVAMTALRRNVTTQCRCFGSGGQRLGISHVFRNGVAAAIAAAGALVAAVHTPVFDSSDGIAMIAGGLVGALVFVLVDKVAEAISPAPMSPRVKG